MKTLNSDYNYLKLNVCISQEESNRAKSLAKSRGFSYQGWLGQLIKRELASAGISTAQPMQQTYLTGTAIKEEE